MTIEGWLVLPQAPESMGEATRVWMATGEQWRLLCLRITNGLPF